MLGVNMACHMTCYSMKFDNLNLVSSTLTIFTLLPMSLHNGHLSEAPSKFHSKDAIIDNDHDSGCQFPVSC